MSSFVAVKNKDGEYEHHKVHKDVSIYIHQLECCINNPEISKLKEKYPDRFKS
jgi:hypothetical protein